MCQSQDRFPQVNLQFSCPKVSKILVDPATDTIPVQSSGHAEPQPPFDSQSHIFAIVRVQMEVVERHPIGRDCSHFQLRSGRSCGRLLRVGHGGCTRKRDRISDRNPDRNIGNERNQPFHSRQQFWYPSRRPSSRCLPSRHSNLPPWLVMPRTPQFPGVWTA